MFATVEDVRARHLGQATDAQIGAVLADANAILLRKVPELDIRITEDETLTAVARAIVCKAVNRYLSNPVDATQQSVGPFAVTYSNNSSVYFTQSELDMVSPHSNNANDYARSVYVMPGFSPARRW